jgi:trimethylamine:corrinoid methyltransferase-like protein
MILEQKGCERIHATALETLRDVGVRVDDPGVVQRDEEPGATVTHENVVHIPESRVVWACAWLPRSEGAAR